jgi:ferredoxin
VADAGVHIVHVIPADVDIPVRGDESLFDAATRAGYEWPTICFGQALCTHCHVRIQSGGDGVSAILPHEALAIRRIAQRYGADEDTESIRLACQLYVTGDVVVEQRELRTEQRKGG